jgi:hypothetical protein
MKGAEAPFRLSEMNVASLIERNGLARVASGLTLGSGEITDGVKILISSRTIRRIDLNPMSGVETTTGGDSGFDTSQKSGGLGFSTIATSPKAKTVFVDPTCMIEKSVIVSPTMTDIVLGDHIKRATHDDRTVLVTTQINQIFANSERKCHVVNSCVRC